MNPFIYIITYSCFSWHLNFYSGKCKNRSNKVGCGNVEWSLIMLKKKSTWQETIELNNLWGVVCEDKCFIEFIEPKLFISVTKSIIILLEWLTRICKLYLRGCLCWWKLEIPLEILPNNEDLFQLILLVTGQCTDYVNLLFFAILMSEYGWYTFVMCYMELIQS